MSNTPPPMQQRVHTRIWHEEPEPGNAFATRVARCHGYDVYGAMLGRTRWVEMLYLLVRGEAPSPAQADLLETLAIALANPGPRDPAVHAAMCAGVGGSTAASSLMAALAVGAGGLGGAREVLLALQQWSACGTDLNAWHTALSTPARDPSNVWPGLDHPLGFDPHGTRTPLIVLQALQTLGLQGRGDGPLVWLAEHLVALQAAAGCPLAMSGVAAAALHELGFSPEQGEMLHLLLRLPGAAAHALEQADYGHKAFPFFALDLAAAGLKESA